MNFEQALRDRRLLGALPCFRDLSTYAGWLAFSRAVHGLPMTHTDLALFRQHTGRQLPRPGGYPEAVAIVGVQSGKTRIASAFAVHAAIHYLELNSHPVPMIVEMTSYHWSGKGIRMGQFLQPHDPPVTTLTLQPEEAAFKARLYDCFASQRAVLQHFPIRWEKFRRSPSYDFTTPPTSTG